MEEPVTELEQEVGFSAGSRAMQGSIKSDNRDL